MSSSLHAWDTLLSSRLLSNHCIQVLVVEDCLHQARHVQIPIQIGSWWGQSASHLCTRQRDAFVRDGYASTYSRASHAGFTHPTAQLATFRWRTLIYVALVHEPNALLGRRRMREPWTWVEKEKRETREHMNGLYVHAFVQKTDVLKGV